MVLLIKLTESKSTHNITVRQVIFRVLFEISLQLSTKIDGILKVIPHARIAKTYVSITVKDITDVHRDRPFHITTVSIWQG